MNGQEEKDSGLHGWWPPFVMNTKYYDFGLSEKDTHELNRTVYKARLQYAQACAIAERTMIETIQNYLKEQKIWGY